MHYNFNGVSQKTKKAPKACVRRGRVRTGGRRHRRVRRIDGKVHRIDGKVLRIGMEGEIRFLSCNQDR